MYQCTPAAAVPDDPQGGSTTPPFNTITFDHMLQNLFLQETEMMQNIIKSGEK